MKNMFKSLHLQITFLMHFFNKLSEKKAKVMSLTLILYVLSNSLANAFPVASFCRNFNVLMKHTQIISIDMFFEPAKPRSNLPFLFPPQKTCRKHITIGPPLLKTCFEKRPVGTSSHRPVYH